MDIEKIVPQEKVYLKARIVRAGRKGITRIAMPANPGYDGEITHDLNPDELPEGALLSPRGRAKDLEGQNCYIEAVVNHVSESGNEIVSLSFMLSAAPGRLSYVTGHMMKASDIPDPGEIEKDLAESTKRNRMAARKPRM